MFSGIKSKNQKAKKQMLSQEEKFKKMQNLLDSLVPDYGE